MRTELELVICRIRLGENALECHLHVDIICLDIKMTTTGMFKRSSRLDLAYDPFNPNEFDLQSGPSKMTQYGPETIKSAQRH